jgi:hypothetical protein
MFNHIVKLHNERSGEVLLCDVCTTSANTPKASARHEGTTALDQRPATWSSVQRPCITMAHVPLIQAMRLNWKMSPSR